MIHICTSLYKRIKILYKSKTRQEGTWSNLLASFLVSMHSIHRPNFLIYSKSTNPSLCVNAIYIYIYTHLCLVSSPQLQYYYIKSNLHETLIACSFIYSARFLFSFHHSTTLKDEKTLSISYNIPLLDGLSSLLFRAHN